MTAPFTAAKHPRAAGGLFAATAASQTTQPTGAWAAGPIRRGTGRKGLPDQRVPALQKQLNALGFGDERGRPLLVDGIDGAHTTAAVKRFQKANGLPQTGVVDAKLMVAILTAKPKPTKPAPARARAKMAAHHTPRRRPPAGKKKTSAAAPPAARDLMSPPGQGHSRLGI